MKRQRLGSRIVRSPEQLETRAMLAGGGFLPFAFAGRQIFAFSPPDAGQGATALVSSQIAGRGGHDHELGAFASHSHGTTTSFTATLTDSEGTATGTATYSTHTSSDGEIETTFKVSVSGATADTTFDVTVGDTVIGQLTTDDTGTGSLVLSSNPTGDEQQLPDDFPANVGSDTAISIGTLSGSLVQDTDSGDTGDDGGGDHGGCHHSSAGTSLTTTLTDSDTTSTATGTATYSVDSETGDTTFSVSVTGATASTTLDVAIDSTVIGQITTDETGAGSLELSSNPTGTQQALPSNFPTSISSGSTVTVGTLSGTFASTATTTSSLHFGGLRFGRLR